MKRNNIFKIVTLLFVVCLACGVFAACGGPGPIELTMKETAATYINESVTLRVTASRELTSKETYEWSSSAESVATVDEKGKVTGVSAGSAVITVAVGEATASCTVTVTKRITFSLDEGEEAVKLDAEDSNNKTYQLHPVCNECEGGGACSAVTYEVDEPDFAEVSASGLITAKANTTARKKTVTVTASAHGLTATFSFTVINPSAALAYTLQRGPTNANICKDPDQWYYFNKTSDGADISAPEAEFSSDAVNGDWLHVTYDYIGATNTAGDASQNYLRYQPDFEMGTQYIFSCKLTANKDGYISIGEAQFEVTANIPTSVSVLQTVNGSVPLNIRLFVFGGEKENPEDSVEFTFEDMKFEIHTEHQYDETTHKCVCGATDPDYVEDGNSSAQ